MPQLGLGLGTQFPRRILFSGLLNKYAGAAAAYSLRSLSSGWLSNNVVEVRRNSDNTSQGFTASQITSGAMLDFVVNGNGGIYSGQIVFDGVNDSIDTGAYLIPTTADFTLTVEFVPPEIPASSSTLFGQSSTPDVGRTTCYVNSSGNIFLFSAVGLALTTTNTINLNEVNTVVFSRSGSNFSLTLNGGTAETATSAAAFTHTLRNFEIGDSYSGVNFKGFITSFSIGAITWNGTEEDATSNGWTVNGTPITYDGFVSTWYDQSGNGNDATQATTTAQPKIVSAGSLVTVGGRPSLDFFSNSSVESAAFADGAASSLFLVFNNQSADGNRKIMFVKNEFPNSGIIVNYRGDSAIGQYDFASFDGATQSLTYSDLTSPRFGLSTSIINGSGKEIWLNGTSKASNAVSFVGGTTSARLGSTTFGSGFNISEAILYQSDETANRTAIEDNINSHYSIY